MRDELYGALDVAALNESLDAAQKVWQERKSEITDEEAEKFGRLLVERIERDLAKIRAELDERDRIEMERISDAKFELVSGD